MKDHKGICPRCSERPRPDGKTYCKPCTADYKREWNARQPPLSEEEIRKRSARNRASYIKHRPKRLASTRKWYREHRDEVLSSNRDLADLKRIVVIEKKNAPCADCGRKFPTEAMDFDHIRGIKKFSIARAVRQPVSMKQFLEEIEKCEVVCACCHRIRTTHRIGEEVSLV
jgi:hypothetical protein